MTSDSKSDLPPPRPPRRKRYGGTHPKKFHEKYKERDPQRFPDIHQHVKAQGRTPAGTHLPIMVDEIIDIIQPQPGLHVADATLGYGGHAEKIIPLIQPGGTYFAFDFDADQLNSTATRLSDQFPHAQLSFHHSNFAGLATPLAVRQLAGYDIILVDLGVSSMQIDDPSRGFAYKHDAPLDMRMDKRTQRTAANLLNEIDEENLAAALRELADEPDARGIARAIIAARQERPLATTWQLVDLVLAVKGTSRLQWARRDPRPSDIHPAARTFQALRIVLNDELGNLRQLMRIAPWCLADGGRMAILTFHSGEEKIVRQALADGLRDKLYAAVSHQGDRPTPAEIHNNPRSRSARLHWATKP